ncbi:MAG: stage V sporulation protein AC [Ruminococcaceae bacterium]|nr:stage V sporulation protein AC [Oscillospiraceae bacterium]
MDVKAREKKYSKLVKKKSPSSELFKDMCRAFVVGGLICVVGQLLSFYIESFGLKKEDVSSITSSLLILIGALLTGLGWYDNIARYGKAGTLVPITGFANSIVSPAMEYKTEGYILGVGAKMFIIAGPVLVYGISASVIYGVVYYFMK